ncbi:hypothetical protein ABPG72_010755 [Tetrahymena utriculariae]
MDLVVAGGIAAASLIPIFGLQRDIKSIQHTLREMNGLPTYSPGELYHLLQQGKDIMKYFKESDGGENLKGKVFLQGRIDARYPVKSVLVERDLIYRKFQVDNIYSNDRGSKIIRNPKRSLLSFTQNDSNKIITESSPYMDLYNYSEKSNVINQIQNPSQFKEVSIRIMKNLSANYKYALQLIMIKKFFKKLNLAEHAIIVIGLLIEFIFSILHLKIRGRGIKIGYQEIEFGIPIKTLITVFGEVIFNRKTGKLLMKKPEFFFNSDARLRSDLKNKIANKRILMILLCIPLFFSGAYLYQKLFKIISQFIRKQRQKKEDQLKKIGSLELDNLACKVCKENVRNIIFKPCHHMTHCKQCFEQLLKQNISTSNNLGNHFLVAQLHYCKNNS